MAKKSAPPAKKGFLSRMADKLDPLKAAQKAGSKATKGANDKFGGGARKRRIDQVLKDAGAKAKGRKSGTKKSYA